MFWKFLLPAQFPPFILSFTHLCGLFGEHISPLVLHSNSHFPVELPEWPVFVFQTSYMHYISLPFITRFSAGPKIQEKELISQRTNTIPQMFSSNLSYMICLELVQKVPASLFMLSAFPCLVFSNIISKKGTYPVAESVVMGQEEMFSN